MNNTANDVNLTWKDLTIYFSRELSGCNGRVLKWQEITENWQATNLSLRFVGRSFKLKLRELLEDIR